MSVVPPPPVPTSTEIVVEGRDLTKVYGSGDAEVRALDGISISFPRGQFTAVMGPSGSGKSTMMHCLAGLDTPTSGEVFIEGKDITKASDSELTLIRRGKVGFIFQFFNLLPMLTAEENITLPLDLAGTKTDQAWSDEIVAKVGLTDRRKHRPSELSGGQQQRVAIARALISRPTVLFADEPTGNLDSQTGEEILRLLRDSVDTYGQTMLMVTHEARAAAMADRVLFLGDGQIVKDVGKSSPTEILASMDEFSRR
jgi:putative ABC transport system ATP-binding protein